MKGQIMNRPEQRRPEQKHCGWQSTSVRFITTFLTVAVMVMIFAFSTEDADRSNETSGAVTRIVLSVISPRYEELPPDQQEELFNSVQTVIRKCAHFSEYTLLGWMLRLCLESWFGLPVRRKLGLWAWAGGALYACTDELHQILVDGRSGQLLDVMIDSSGVLLGTVLAGLLIRKIRKENAAPPDERGRLT